MKQRVNYSGKKINKLTVIDLAIDRYVAGKDILWNCVCECGRKCKIRSSVLKKGKIQSCGCFRYDTGKDNLHWTGIGDISGTHFCKIKDSAKSRKIQFDVDIKYIWELFLKQKGKCAISGIDIGFKSSDGLVKTASLDRIDSKRGYVRGNLQWVHQDVNFMKNDFNNQKFIDLCKIIAEFNKS